jgi:hypothetical protein
MAESVSSNMITMTTFLTRVAQDACKVTGHNIKFWVTAIKSKLADIEILTNPLLVASIPTINSQLFQVGHVSMYIRTLAIMA